MARLQAKQIEKLLASFVRIDGIATGAADATIITTDLTTVLGTAGEGGGAVPLQVATATTPGVVTSGTYNRCEIYNALTKEKLFRETDGAGGGGEELYARITESTGVYTSEYFYIDAITGVETAYTFPATENIDIEIPYQFTFATLPRTFAIGVKSRNVADDAKSNGYTTIEKLTVTAVNTVSNLSVAPVDAAKVELIVNGQNFFAVEHFSVTGLAISFSAPQLTAMGLGQIDTTDEVYARYRRF
jgi:hypothetical protein